MTENKVAREVAEQEFARWAEAMDLVAKMDPDKLDQADKKSLAETREIILNAIERGMLVVEDGGQFVFTPSSGEPITFYEPTGASLMAADTAGAGKDVQKTLRVLADFTRQSVQRYAGMKNRDLRVCQAILVLFLA